MEYLINAWVVTYSYFDEGIDILLANAHKHDIVLVDKDNVVITPDRVTAFKNALLTEPTIIYAICDGYTMQMTMECYGSDISFDCIPLTPFKIAPNSSQDFDIAWYGKMLIRLIERFYIRDLFVGLKKFYINPYEQ